MTLPLPDLSQVLERCRAGDAAAVEALVRAHQGAVYRLALSVLDDPAEADEATQDTFLAALRALPGYRGEAAFTTWLYRIALNASRDRLRRRGAWQRLLGRLRPPPAAPDPRPVEAAAGGRERQAAIWRAVQALGEKHRLPIVLRYYHDLPVAEIAHLLRLSEGTVHSRLSIARDRLRAALQADLGAAEEAEKI
jgi:RNA polymerase sigma-70 factor (ECF subfamily)